jgi:hypothetical protein
MNFLLLCIVTDIISGFIEVVNSMRMEKDAADSGYLINDEKFNDIQDDLDYVVKGSALSMFIPVINILLALIMTHTYLKYSAEILDEMSIAGALDEMTDLEKEEYAKNPSLFNACTIQLKMDKRIEKADKVTIQNGMCKSTVYYESNEDNGDITILKIEGPLNGLSKEEQKKAVLKAIKTQIISVRGTEDVGELSKETTKSNNNDSFTMVFDSECFGKQESKPSIKQQKENLLNLKTKLLAEYCEDEKLSSKQDSISEKKL